MSDQTSFPSHPADSDAERNTPAFASGNPLEPPLASSAYAPEDEEALQADEETSANSKFDPSPLAEAEIARTLNDTALMDSREGWRVHAVDTVVDTDTAISPASVTETDETEADFLADVPTLEQHSTTYDGEESDDGTFAVENWAQTLEPAPLDLDELLASVSTYSGGAYAREDADAMAEDSGDGEPSPRRRGSSPSGEVFTPAPYTPAIPLPGFTRLRRGSLGSIIPAFGLIALGAWMTFTLSSGGALDTRLIGLAVIAIVVLSLLAQWLGSRRWARGSLFLALLLAGTAALLVFSLQPGGLDLLRAYPLLFGIVGLALVGAGTLGRPNIRRVVLPGFLLLVVAAVGLAYNLGFIPSAAVAPELPFWPGLVGLVLVLLLLPLLAALPRRRRSPDARTDLPHASGAHVRS